MAVGSGVLVGGTGVAGTAVGTGVAGIVVGVGVDTGAVVGTTVGVSTIAVGSGSNVGVGATWVGTDVAGAVVAVGSGVSLLHAVIPNARITAELAAKYWIRFLVVSVAMALAPFSQNSKLERLPSGSGHAQLGQSNPPF